MGNRVLVHAGSVLGSDRFGFAHDEQTGAYHKFPQVGHLVIEDDVEIGAGCTVDRGALDATIIESGAKLDNMAHVAHNVCIDRNVVIAHKPASQAARLSGRALSKRPGAWCRGRRTAW